MTTFSVDTSRMQKLARDLERSEIGVDRAVPISVREGAVVVAGQAKALSSWSSRIPGSIRVAAAGDTVVVVAGGARAPHAPVFEHGGHPGTFQHPVFGRPPYVSQNARPVLTPSLIVGEPALERAGLVNLDLAMRGANL